MNGRSRTTAALFAFFLGGIGAHKFYLGQPGRGIVYLLFCWTFIPAIVSFIEAIVLLSTDDQTFNARYNMR
jgi:TM2 domain-containing membrane protein YozV